MINKENGSKQPQKPPVEEKKPEGFIDVAKMTCNSHFMIKDKDTGKILVNKRG